ncbi:MAG: YgjV family protein [Clostridia bacterium]|nr:YgjV family protein [Clostridia bacterium]
MMTDIFIQSLGVIAIVFFVISVQFNKYWQIILFKSLGSFFFGVQYYFLHAYTGVAMEAVGLIRNLIFVFTVKKGRSTSAWIMIFSLITVGIGALTYEGIISFCAILAKVFSCTAYGISKPQTLRMINLPSYILWMVYDAMHFAVVAVVSDSMETVSIIVAMIRLRGNDKEKPLPILLRY